jgi:hypothetical protein
VVDNQSGDDVTVINNLTLIGSPVEQTKDLKELKKIGPDGKAVPVGAQ